MTESETSNVPSRERLSWNSVRGQNRSGIGTGCSGLSSVRHHPNQAGGLLGVHRVAGTDSAAAIRNLSDRHSQTDHRVHGCLVDAWNGYPPQPNPGQVTIEAAGS